jgi:hypothetical protein
MRLSGRRPILLVSLLAAVVAALTLFIANSDSPTTQAMNNFDMSTGIKQCNALPAAAPWTTFGIGGAPACADVLTANTAIDLTTSLCVPGAAGRSGPGAGCPASSFAEGSKNFSSILNYYPSGYQIAGDGLAALDPGEKVGGGANLVFLGLLNNGCSGSFPVSFLFTNVKALPLTSTVALGVEITSVTSGTPGKVTTANPHGFSNGDIVFIHGNVGGTPVIRGYYKVANKTATTFELHDINDNNVVVTTGVAGGVVMLIAHPRDQGKKDRFGAWGIGAPPGPANDDPADTVVDIDGVPDVADGGTANPPISTAYPSYLLDLFDPDFIAGVSNGPLEPVLPVALYGGLSIPTGASTDWVPLYFATFKTADLAAAFTDSRNPLGRLDTAAGGYVSVVVLNDPTSVKASPSPIDDFCSEVISSTMLLGTGGNGNVRFKTPVASGTKFFQSWNMSQRDADGDGRENAFDSCPYSADAPGGAAGFDTDGDGLYNSCDPVPGTAAAGDIDVDGFENGGDNCAFTANNSGADNQKESELGAATYAAAAPDGGAKTDGIGDACDFSGYVGGTKTAPAGASATVANGDYDIRAIVIPKCNGKGVTETDADGDGYCASDQDTASGGSDANATKHTAWASPLTGASSGDTDGDITGARSDWQETFQTLDATHRCAHDTTPNNESGLDRWAFDFDDNKQAGLADVLSYIPVYLTTGNPRWDQNQDGSVGLADILSFIPVYLSSCTVSTAQND